MFFTNFLFLQIQQENFDLLIGIAKNKAYKIAR